MVTCLDEVNIVGELHLATSAEKKLKSYSQKLYKYHRKEYLKCDLSIAYFSIM